MMFISEESISLRIAEPEDARTIYEWENDRSLWRVSETSNPISQFQIEQFLLGNGDLVTNRQLRLMIDLKGTDKAIGCVDLFEYDPINGHIGIGILIEQAYRGQGYAQKALALCIDYLFNNVMVHQIHCLIDIQNVESQHIFEKLGFRSCGTRKDWIKTPEGYVDAIFYQNIQKP
jgi:diamine N-acetyltransferase